VSEAPLPSIAGYRVVRPLARGGMATVLEAWDERLGRRVALKVIRSDVAEDPTFLDRFRHEVQLHSALDHPNVLALTDWGAAPEPFIAMEYVDGGTLRTLLDRAGRLPPELALFVAAEICRGLSAAHEKGIVHRDVKPQNVLLSSAGEVKVADFGISRTSEMTRLTLTGSVVGTPAYMSPEQAMARPLDSRSDLFSVGALLYEMLSGTSPFQADNPATTLRRVVDEVPPPLMDADPTIPFACEKVVARLLSKNPKGRFPAAAEAARSLDAAREEMGLRSPAEAFRRFLERPEAEWRERNRRLSRAHLHRARDLAASPAASPEAALWEALQASLLDPSDTEAGTLAGSLARATGYRLDRNARTRTLELEARHRAEPDDVGLALQLAKAAKIDRDFLRLMGAFLRLREVPVDDPYVKGQIASLVARPSSDETDPTRRVAAAAPSPSGSGPAAPRPQAPARDPARTPPARRTPGRAASPSRPSRLRALGLAAFVLALAGILFLVLR
jgi:serine/threonine protein kinase